MLLKSRNVVGAGLCVLVQYQECLELRETSACSLPDDSRDREWFTSASASQLNAAYGTGEVTK